MEIILSATLLFTIIVKFIISAVIIIFEIRYYNKFSTIKKFNTKPLTKTKGGNFMPKDFVCDTEDCIYYSETEEDCVKETAITIQEGCCCDYEERVNEIKKPKYTLIKDIPKLGSEVFVRIGTDCYKYYKGTFLGYGAYNDDPNFKTYCVQVQTPNSTPYVDYFRNIYTTKNKEGLL